jgi:hypothetical protein
MDKAANSIAPILDRRALYMGNGVWCGRTATSDKPIATIHDGCTGNHDRRCVGGAMCCISILDGDYVPG